MSLDRKSNSLSDQPAHHDVARETGVNGDHSCSEQGKFSLNEVPNGVLSNAMSAWAEINQAGKSGLPISRTIEKGMGYPSGFIFHGDGNDFEKTVAMWAGLIEGTEEGMTWRATAKQRMNGLAPNKHHFVNNARNAAEYLGDNIVGYAGDNGILIVEYDERTGEGYTIAVDNGQDGFPVDVEGSLNIEIADGGFIAAHHGDGIAMGRLIKSNDIAIISHAQAAEVPKGTQKAGKIIPYEYNGPESANVKDLNGSVVIAHCAPRN